MSADSPKSSSSSCSSIIDLCLCICHGLNCISLRSSLHQRAGVASSVLPIILSSGRPLHKFAKKDEIQRRCNNYNKNSHDCLGNTIFYFTLKALSGGSSCRESPNVMRGAIFARNACNLRHTKLPVRAVRWSVSQDSDFQRSSTGRRLGRHILSSALSCH